MTIMHRTGLCADDCRRRLSARRVPRSLLVDSLHQLGSPTGFTASRAKPTCWLILLTLVTFLSIASAAVSSSGVHPPVQYVEGEAIVTFKPSADLTAVQSTLKGHSLQFSRHFAFLSEKRGRHSGLVHASDRTT